MKDTRTETRNRRKSLLLALFIHAIVVGVFVYPFLLSEQSEDLSFETIVTFDFRDQPEIRSASASAARRERNEVKNVLTEREAAPSKPAPEVLPSKPSVPVLTAPEPMPPLPDVPAPAAPEPDPVVKPSPAPPAPVVVDVPKPSTPANSSPGKGSSAGHGNSTSSPETGSGSTVSDAGDGTASLGNGLDAEGALARQVVFRPDLSKIVRANGIIALSLCINRDGKVTDIKINESQTTIDDIDLRREAIKTGMQYRFKTDRSAPVRECGVLSIRVSGFE